MIAQIEAALADAITQILTLHLPGAPAVALQPTRKEFEGDFTYVTFAVAKPLGKTPEEAGKLVGEALLLSNAGLSGYNVVKGFLNITLHDSVWLQAFDSLRVNERYGQLAPKSQRVMVEYSSPNTNKPLHLGHLRNNFLGYAISNILKLAGYEVTMANLVNDRGIHICKSMVTYAQFGNGETPESAGLKGDHLVGKYYVLYDKTLKAQIAQAIANGKTQAEAEATAPIALAAQDYLRRWEAGDDEIVSLWKKMNGWVYDGFSKSYDRMGVRFDQYYYESDTYLLGKQVVEEGLANGVFFRKDDNSVWVDLTDDGLDQKLLLRGDGTSVYITQDMGTADLKYEQYQTEQSLYVVGNEQDYHFQVLFLILKKLGRPYADGLKHVSYGMVELPAGRMKSREGTVVDADDLMDEMHATAKARTEELGKTQGLSDAELSTLYETLGLGAIKYFLLRVEPKKKMLFNPEESIDLHGNTATAIQYTYARIQSVLRKGAETGIAYTPVTSLEPEERTLIVLLSSLEKVVSEAAAEVSPANVANYCYEVARAYNAFFAQHSILSAATSAQIGFRLSLSAKTAETLALAMGALGIAMPSRM